MKFEIINPSTIESEVDKKIETRLHISNKGSLCFQIKWDKSYFNYIHFEGMGDDGWSNLCWIDDKGYFIINPNFGAFKLMGIKGDIK